MFPRGSTGTAGLHGGRSKLRGSSEKCPDRYPRMPAPKGKLMYA